MAAIAIGAFVHSCSAVLLASWVLSIGKCVMFTWSGGSVSLRSGVIEASRIEGPESARLQYLARALGPVMGLYVCETHLEYVPDAGWRKRLGLVLPTGKDLRLPYDENPKRRPGDPRKTVWVTVSQLNMPLWIPSSVSVLFSLILFVRRRRRLRRADSATCEICTYDLRGNVSGVCPECGTGVLREQSSVPGARSDEIDTRRRVIVSGEVARSAGSGHSSSHR